MKTSRKIEFKNADSNLCVSWMHAHNMEYFTDDDCKGWRDGDRPEKAVGGIIFDRSEKVWKAFIVGDSVPLSN